MTPFLSRLFTLFVLATVPAWALDVTPLPADSTTPEAPAQVVTNDVPTPAVTNPPPPDVIGIPSVPTNIPPYIKVKKTTTATGTSMLGSFTGSMAGKYSVSGRTLKLPVPEATPRAGADWRRNLDFGMNQSKGNTETLRYSLGLDAVKEQDSNLFRLRAKSTYGESDGDKDTENAFAGFRHEHLMTPRFYTLENLEWVTDTIADLRYRITAILSPGLRVVRTEDMLFNLEAGAGYITEKKSSEQDGYAAGRLAATAERIITAHVLIWCTAEYLPKLADPGTFLINAEAGMATYITRDLSLNVVYQERYDSDPVEDKKAADTVLATALSLNF